MSEDKGGEYSKRLSAELKSSLYQRGQEGMGWDGGHMTPGDLQVCGFFRIVLPFNFVWWHSIRRDYENSDLNFKHDFTIIQKLFGSHFISLFSDYLP